jgi:hypothetical protein
MAMVVVHQFAVDLVGHDPQVAGLARRRQARERDGL